MCEYMSFFVHRRADKRPLDRRYKFGDLRSHSGTAEAWGIPYGADGDDWAEVEWTGDDESSLVVRDERADVLKAVVLADFKTRSEAMAYALRNLPSGLTTLDLSGVTLPAGIEFPSGLTTLDLSGVTLPEGIAFPAGLTTLYLRRATLPAGITFPSGLTTLDLSRATLPAGMVVPEGTRVFGAPRRQ